MPTSEGAQITRRTLRGYAGHPNIAGLLVLGLGCEMIPAESLLDGLDLPADKPVTTLVIQETGGIRRTVRAGVEAIEAMLPAIDALRRTPAPVSELVLGLNCGGSDGYSGITANPALGHASDQLVARGGTSILAETPEVFGAEHLLLRRAVSRSVGQKLLDRLDWWKGYTAAGGGTMDNNPSPGNKAGGLTTILEKSLGAVAKGGTAELVEVYEYAEPVTARGFTFMDTPGYDPVSVTGLVAGGATVVVFTTGRGSVLGCKPTPSIKVATNTATYLRMTEDMDLNAGRIVDGTATVASVGDELFELIIAVASGRQTVSEELDLGLRRVRAVAARRGHLTARGARRRVAAEQPGQSARPHLTAAPPPERHSRPTDRAGDRPSTTCACRPSRRVGGVGAGRRPSVVEPAQDRAAEGADQGKSRRDAARTTDQDVVHPGHAAHLVDAPDVEGRRSAPRAQQLSLRVQLQRCSRHRGRQARVAHGYLRGRAEDADTGPSAPRRRGDAPVGPHPHVGASLPHAPTHRRWAPS